MKNGKQPINPSMWTKIGNGADDYQPLKDGQKTGWEIKFGGLTKREYFAGLAMQGLLARNPNRQNGETDLGMLEANRIAEESVVMADFILEELEKDGE